MLQVITQSKVRPLSVAQTAARLTSLDIDKHRLPVFGKRNLSKEGVIGWLMWDADNEKVVPSGRWDLTRADGTEFVIGTDLIKVGSPTLDWTSGLKLTPSGVGVVEGLRFACLGTTGTSTPDVNIRSLMNITESSAADDSMVSLGYRAANGNMATIGVKRVSAQWQVGLIYGVSAASFSLARNTADPGTSTSVKVRWNYYYQDDGTNMSYNGQMKGGNLTGGGAKAAGAPATAFGLGATGIDDYFYLNVALGASGTISATVKNFTAELML